MTDKEEGRKCFEFPKDIILKKNNFIHKQLHLIFIDIDTCDMILIDCTHN